MADFLRYKIVDTTAGAFSIHPGLNLTQILKVARQGIQHDYISILAGLGTSNRCWSFISTRKRVIFKDAFEEGEQIFILYKVTL